MTPLWFWSFTDPLDPLRMMQEQGLKQLRNQITSGRIVYLGYPKDEFAWIERDIDEDRQGLYR